MPAFTGGTQDAPILTNVSDATETAGVKLEKLFIAEVSGVDDPANELPGWMVAKSAGLSDAELEGSADDETATSIVEKIKNLILGKEIDVTKDEVAEVFDAKSDELVEKIAERLSKSVEPATSEATTEAAAPAAEAAPAAPAAEVVDEPAAPALSAEDIAKAFEEAQAPLLEILDKVLDRVEALEKGTATRKSLTGQEDNHEDAPEEPTVQDAIKAALSGQKVTLT